MRARHRLPGPGGERGAALLVSLLVLLIVSTVATGMAIVASTEMEIAGNYRGATRAFYAADGAAQATVNEMVTMASALRRFPSTAELATIVPPDVADSAVEDVAIDKVGPEVIEPIQSGFHTGLVAVTQDFAVQATAASTDWPPGRASVSLGVLVDLIPIFQFAVFYDEDLEIIPGPPMTLTGRVHSNSDIYLNSENLLRIDSNLTSAGNVYHRRKDRSAPLKPVEIRAAGGAFPEMDGLDSDDEEWETEALERWDGNVRSSVHGIVPLNLAISDADDPRLIIEPSLDGDSAGEQDTKLFYKADVRILNGIAYDLDGDPLSTTDAGGNNALRPTIIHDPREDQDMLIIEVDMGVLANTEAWPANGLIYVGGFDEDDGMPPWERECLPCWGPDEWEDYPQPWLDDDTEFAVKLTHGAELAAPVTVVTDNPLYLRGDYNTVDKKGVAIMADAITILSNNWGRMAGMGADDPDEDLDYSLLALSGRNANNTTVNAAVMLGNTETFWGAYNGGLENVLRFLERWSGDTLTFRGSIIDLWYSDHAIGAWGQSNVYNPPNRDWDFDADLLTFDNLPPFTPMVFSVRIYDWRRE